MKTRISAEALELMHSLDDSKRKYIEEKIISIDGIIKKEQVDNLLREIDVKPSVEVNKATFFSPEAKDFDSRLQIDTRREVTGKSRTQSKVDDFIAYFRNRFERITRLFPPSNNEYSTVKIEDLKKSPANYDGRKIRLPCMVYEKTETKNRNTMLIVEDITGTHRVIISKNSSGNQDLAAQADEVVKDDILMVYGSLRGSFIIADYIEYPSKPKTNSERNEERDVAIAYISDTHFGSKYFVKDAFEKFIKWLRGEIPQQRELAGKVKYLVIGGDVVDGIGIYPGQEKELLIKDIYNQYGLFDEFMALVPDYIEIIAIPGNHDAVRRGEPMPAISKEMIKSGVKLAGNPAVVEIEGLKHLLYHGTSIDSMITSIPKLSYERPEDVMVEMLKRRHLSTLYGVNPIVPESIDYMVIDSAPDIFHSGHVHKNGHKMFRGTLVINSGTFQSQTEFQVKQGHIPTPGEVYVYRPAKNKLSTVRFA